MKKINPDTASRANQLVDYLNKNTGVKVVYLDVASGASADATYSATDKTDFSTLALSSGSVINVPYITLEHNGFGLNGTRRMLGNNTVAFWSTSVSDANGEFATPPVIIIEFDGLYTSLGLSVVFDTVTGGYCSDIDVAWYRGSTLLDSDNFKPDGTSYFCQKSVTAWNKIVITLNKTSLPNRYAKITEIVFGLLRELTDNDLRNVDLTLETNLISAELPNSQANITIDSNSSISFAFQSKQPLEVWNNDVLLGVFYVNDAVRKGATIYNVVAYDALSVLAEQKFSGGAYLHGISAKTLAAAVAAISRPREDVDSDFEIEYGADVVDTTLYGLLEEQDKRSALQQVLFAWGVCCTTDRTRKIRIITPPTTPAVKTADAVYMGATINTDAAVTEVVVTAHTYSAQLK